MNGVAEVVKVKGVLEATVADEGMNTGGTELGLFLSAVSFD